MVVVDRAQTPRGELALRHDGTHYEVISNGVCLMDTRGGSPNDCSSRRPWLAADSPRPS